MRPRHHYYLEFEDPRRDFHLTIPGFAAGSGARPEASIPDWTRLTCHQCTNCPLQYDDAEHCPPARDMIDLVGHFSSSHSYDRCNLHVWTNSMMHTIRTDLQRALAYLYPAVLAASSCPYAPLLSPLTKFGKPFPDMVDMFYYALSFRLIGNFLQDDKHFRAEAVAQDSSDAFALAQVLHGLLLRIKQSALSDANVNALVKDIQWSYAGMHPLMFFKKQLGEHFPRQQEHEK